MRRPVGLLLFALAAVMAALLTARFARPGIKLSPNADGIIDFYTRSHSAAYGAIDRRAFNGMKAESVAELLRKDGYVCELPKPAAGDRLSGIHQMTCKKEVRWPLARALSIKASIDYGLRGGLVAATASSTGAADGQPLRKRLVDWLRHAGWIEPETLQVKGFEFDSADTLARYAADALSSGGWYATCGEDIVVPACAEQARNRRESGLPPVPQAGVAMGDAMAIHAAMERVRLMPLMPRGADNLPADSLIVRVADDTMWLDFVGKDLSGRTFMVSIALNSEGGTPVKLVARLGAESKAVTIAGAPRRANSGTVVYLVPEAGQQDGRPGLWLNMPNEAYPGTYKRLAEVLPRVDPLFVPQIVKAVIASVSAANRPEESLGLYPAIQLIERRANVLRLAHAELWLARDQASQLIREAYHGDLVTRAAWAVAMCESTAGAPVRDASCWMNFAVADPDASAMLRAEVSAQQVLYSGLEPTHPLRLRLKKLSDAFSPD